MRVGTPTCTVTKNLLVLGNGTTCAGAYSVAHFFEQVGLRVTIHWAANNDFPADLASFDGCFLTGSPHGAYEAIDWIEQEHRLIQAMAERDMPILGVCFGSQILASALCGRDQIFRRERCEVGFICLPLTAAGKMDTLTAQLTDSVDMFVWHNDEVRATHEDMVILASSSDCPNQIWRYRDRPIWGIQGHPELTRTTAVALFDEERAIFEQDGADVGQLKAAAHDALEAKTMLERFAMVVLTQS